MARLHRVAERHRKAIRVMIDGRPHAALDGDSLLTAILTAQGWLRFSEFGDGPRAGFCLIGACQDCWVRLDSGRRVRACSTPARDGMAVRTAAEGGGDAG